MKQLGVCEDEQTAGYSFFLPKTFKPIIRSTCCTKHLYGISWNSGCENYNVLERIEKLRSLGSGFFAIGSETKIISLDDYACPKSQYLIFKDEENDWRCSSYPFCDAKALECAEKSICIRYLNSYKTCTQTCIRNYVFTKL